MTLSSGPERMAVGHTSADWAARITLGTAQLSDGYGATRRDPLAPDVEAVAELLAAAWTLGIRRIDTAPDYGGAEGLLGAVGLGGWHVDTKLPQLPDEVAHAATGTIESWVRRRIESSLETLGIERIATLILHRPSVLITPVGEGVLLALRALKDEGLVGAIGVSVYGPDEALDLLDDTAERTIDVVQAPVSVVDRRMLAAAITDRLHAAGAELHARSVYLQGILLTSTDRRPRWARAFDGALTAWDGWIDAQGDGAALPACLGFVLERSEVDRVVIGVEDAGQLLEMDAALGGPLAELAALVPDAVAVDDVAVIDPRRWEHGR